MEKRRRIYLDTSVFGGYYDDEFSVLTRRLFEEIRAGRFTVVVSTATIEELSLAPAAVQDLLATLPDEAVETVEPSDEITELRNAYMKAGVVTRKWLTDAEHIATASVARVEIIVSWNFRHIVHYDKIRGYHAVNLLAGYPMVPIHSPREVVRP